MQYKSPGVYIDEISKFPPSVAEVETAIPAFIGYTENTVYKGQDLLLKPTRIKALAEFIEVFGGPYNELFEVTVTGAAIDTPPAAPAFIYKMYYALRSYFENGGGPCYIVPVGTYSTSATIDSPPSVNQGDMVNGLAAIRKEDEPTILLFPDATSLTSTSEFYDLYKQALRQCAELQDRVTIIDVYDGYLDYQAVGVTDVINDNSDGFRSGIGNNNLKYGAAYYPWLKSSYNFAYDGTSLPVTGGSLPAGTTLKKDVPPEGDATLEAISLYHLNNDLYHQIVDEIEKFSLLLPPSATMAGVYAAVDNARGVWKAPANVSLSGVKEPAVILDDDAQDGLNVHSTGKSVNAIRKFTGKGTIVWGARTLAGNDNEWRYISVRRFYNMVEESVKKASEKFVFEPNDANTWAKIRSMIRNYLTTLWRQGSLAGAAPEDAFFVSVGLGETMTAIDILEGKMIIEIGLAAVRPSEFIVLKFSHKMQQS